MPTRVLSPTEWTYKPGVGNNVQITACADPTDQSSVRVNIRVTYVDRSVRQFDDNVSIAANRQGLGVADHATHISNTPATTEGINVVINWVE